MEQVGAVAAFDDILELSVSTKVGGTDATHRLLLLLPTAVLEAVRHVLVRLALNDPWQPTLAPASIPPTSIMPTSILEHKVVVAVSALETPRLEAYPPGLERIEQLIEPIPALTTPFPLINEKVDDTRFALARREVSSKRGVFAELSVATEGSGARSAELCEVVDDPALAHLLPLPISHVLEREQSAHLLEGRARRRWCALGDRSLVQSSRAEGELAERGGELDQSQPRTECLANRDAA